MTDVIAVTGEKIVLKLTGADVVQGPVTVSFEAFDDEEVIVRDFWEEKLTAEAGPEIDGLPSVNIPWRVNVNGSLTMPEQAVSILFTVKGISGLKASNRTRLSAFKVTSNPTLRDIMLHEFAKKGAKGFELDEGPLKKVLDELTPQQRKLLATHNGGPAGQRLVVFITLQPENNLRMHADIVGEAISVKPNATFTVFHCQGAGKPVTLICHTAHFVLNLRNPATLAHVSESGGFKPALARDNTEPPLHKIGSFANEASHFRIWSRIFASDGEDIMPGNMMHGQINTIGCWMTFRNFNWPRSKSDEFDRIYVKLHRQDKTKATEAALAAQGYDAPATATQSSSPQKFYWFDRNFAYQRFFRQIVGVRYFAREFRGIFCSNNRNTHGLVFEKQLELAETERFALQEGDNGFITHDGESRRKIDTKFKPEDSLWAPNILGFKTADGFVPTVGNFKDLEALQPRTWADLFLFRADDLPVRPVKPTFFIP